MFKRSILSFVMVIALVMSMVSAAFAAETNSSKEFNAADGSFSVKLDLKIDNTEVKPGDEVEISITSENVSNADTTKFNIGVWNVYEFNNSEKEPYGAVVESSQVEATDGLTVTNAIANSGKLIFQNKSSDTLNVSDFFVKLKLKIKNDIEPQTLNLTQSIVLNSTKTADRLVFGNTPIIITNNATPEPTEATYTISANPSASAEAVHVGDTFTVDVVASADQAADIAAVNATLNYNSDIVKPIAAESKALTEGKGQVSYYGDGTGAVTADGQGKVYLFGDKASTDSNGLVVATYTFEALKSGKAEFSIADGAKIGKSGETAEFAAVSGAAASVDIAERPDEKDIILNDIYKGAPDGENVLKYIAAAMPAEGNAYFYGDDAEPLYYAGTTAEGKYLFLGFVKENSVDTLKAVSEKSGSYVTLADSGDLNDSGSVNAIDSLIAYELSNGIYKADTDMSKLSAKARLEADINRDGTVDSKDARAIMYKALNIQDPEASQTVA